MKYAKSKHPSVVEYLENDFGFSIGAARAMTSVSIHPANKHKLNLN